MANTLGLDLSQIADLDTAVATAGALRAGEMMADDVFEITIAIVVLTGTLA